MGPSQWIVLIHCAQDSITEPNGADSAKSPSLRIGAVVGYLGRRLTDRAGSPLSFRAMLSGRGNMDHNEALRKFEHLMIREADRAQEVATELEALISHLSSEKSRQLAQLQVKASHRQAKEFRELAINTKEN